MFRSFTLALPGMMRSGNATADARAVLDAIHAGRFYSRIDALAAHGSVRVTATSGGRRAVPGDDLPLDGPVTLRVETNAPSEALVVIVRDGVEIRRGDGSPIEETQPAEPAVYRVEVRLPGAPGDPPVPWIVSNPIYVGRTAEPAPASAGFAPSSAAARQVIYEDQAETSARVEHSADSQAVVAVQPAIGGRQLTFRYALGGRLSEGPYAAMAFPVSAVQTFDRVTFVGRADHPMRFDVQLRAPAGAGERWQRSIYLDETARTISVRLADMTPVVRGQQGAPRLDVVDSLLFVIDTANTPLGGNGKVWIDDLRFER
jgi:hypothetical protein